jgi:hypothetical protein
MGKALVYLKSNGRGFYSEEAEYPFFPLSFVGKGLS